MVLETLYILFTIASTALFMSLALVSDEWKERIVLGLLSILGFYVTMQLFVEIMFLGGR